MTATEELRRMLDEAGVEWEDMSLRPYACTSWCDPDGEPCTALEGADDIPDGKLSVQALLTSEQAIAATLGSCNCSSNCTNGERTETCHDKNGFDFMFGFECTVCGAMTDGYMLSPADTGHYTQFNFCPMCGRRIVQ